MTFRNTLSLLCISIFLTACFGFEKDNEFYEIGEYGADETGTSYDGYEKKELTIAQSQPPAHFTEIGMIRVRVGKGCDGKGYMGTYPLAIKELKKQADRNDADYAQIIRIIEPQQKPGCYDMSYTMRAKLFRNDEGTLRAQQRRAQANLPPATPQKSPTDKLRELKSLLDDGIISQSDYDEQKQKILSQGY